MESLQPMAPALALAGSVLGVVAVVGWLTLQHRFQRFARPYEELARAAEKDGVSTALQAQILGVERNSERIQAAMDYAHRIETQLGFALQGVGFLKYDAFEDIRGSQSYSLCLLDVHRNGFVITSIAGRNDYRGYAKPVVNGVCDLALSDEEKQVLEMAKERLGKTTPADVVATAAKPAKPVDVKPQSSDPKPKPEPTHA
jgi:hypothetical protein